MKRHIFIGDVHGCIAELVRLCNELEINPEKDKVIFVGDLVDKGPESLSVLRLVRMWMSLFPQNVFAVAGNHEEKASRMAKKGKYVEEWCKEATEEDWAFIDSLPLTVYFPDIDVRVVHGGVSPRSLEKHPDLFAKAEEKGSNWQKGGGKVMDRARRMLRVRYVKPDTGAMITLGEEQEGDPFWSEVYDGAHGTIIYGHSPWREVRIDKHAVGIDTGCVIGWKLTGMVIEDDSDFDWVARYHQVQAEKKYAIPLRERKQFV